MDIGSPNRRRRRRSGRRLPASGFPVWARPPSEQSLIRRSRWRRPWPPAGSSAPCSVGRRNEGCRPRVTDRSLVVAGGACRRLRGARAHRLELHPLRDGRRRPARVRGRPRRAVARAEPHHAAEGGLPRGGRGRDAARAERRRRQHLGAASGGRLAGRQHRRPRAGRRPVARLAAGLDAGGDPRRRRDRPLGGARAGFDGGSRRHRIRAIGRTGPEPAGVGGDRRARRHPRCGTAGALDDGHASGRVVDPARRSRRRLRAARSPRRACSSTRSTPSGRPLWRAPPPPPG